jgi:hypothetical protein
MSYYGGGAVSSDFPGLARARRQKELPDVFQIYLSGCAGDVTAARYNNGDDVSRQALAGRLVDALDRAWRQTSRAPLEKLETRIAEVRFELPTEGPHSPDLMEKTLADPASSKAKRLDAALGLSWAKRVGRGEPVDVASIDFGPAQFLLLPAESFVEFQLAAQRVRPGGFVVVAGYGECGPGYIPTEVARAEGYVEEHGYCWVAAGAEDKLKRAIADALILK